MLIEHHIPVTRSARFYTLGNISEKTKDIWILIHGHKQLAGDFLSSFSDLAESGSYLFAPEGLMRQYIKGDSGNVGASWMTKEDRESDISDYVDYLDKLYFDEVLPLAKTHSLKINTLGFSQGAATLSRWLTLGKAKVDKAVFWCGSIAHDVDFSGFKDFKNTEIHQVFGSNDPYYDSSFFNSQTAILKKAGITPRVHIFEGGHEVNTQLMEEAGVLS
jgi:predicted esterase